jgi:predicted dehydrogenase
LSNKFEIGIIGAGSITTILHLPLLESMENIKIKYIADINEPKDLAKVYKINSYNVNNLKKLPDCDIVLIATPVGVRSEYIKEFSSRNIPIFTEKPFAINLDEHKKNLSYSNPMTANYMKIWYNSSKLFNEIIKNKAFGKVQKIVIKEGGIIGKTNRGSDTYQSNKKLSGGGVIMESACHTLSVLSDIFPEIDVINSKIIWEKELDVQAEVNFIVKGDENIPIEYMTSLIEPIVTECILYYDNCFITFNHSIPNSDFTINNYDDQKILNIKNESKYATSSQQAYYLVWKEFIDKIENNEKIDSKKSTSIKTTELISKIYELGDNN